MSDTATPTPSRSRPNMTIILVVGSLITAIALGTRSTMGVFLDPISDDLVLGTSTFGLTVAIQNLVWGFGQPIAGAIADRYGAARVLAFGAVLYAAGLFLLANSTSGLQLHLTGGLITGLALTAASFSVVLSAVGRLVPDERRTFALGIVTAFGSLGQFMLVPLAQVLIDRQGWTTALTVLALLTLVIGVVAKPLGARPETSTAATQSEDTESLREVVGRAARHRSYVLLNLAFFVCGFHVTFIGVHLPKYVEDIGQSAAIGSWTLSLIGLFNVAGAFLAGVLGQRHSKTRLLTLIYIGRTLSMLVLLVVPASPATSLVFAALMGIFWLSTVPLTSGIVMAQFGLKHAGTLFGVVFFTHQLGAFAGSYGGGAIREAAGSYEAWWWLSAALSVVAALLHLMIDDGPADAPPGAPTTPTVRRFGFRRPRLAPTVATATAFGALVAFTVATTDTSAAGVEARQHSVVCFLHLDEDTS